MELKRNFTEILVVDDDKLVSMIQVSGLRKKLSFPIAAHENGQSALEAIIKAPEKNFLVLLDLNMPVMNGWEFLEEVRRRSLMNLQVVVVSSSVNASDRTRSCEFPQVIDFLEKPLLGEQYSMLAMLAEKGEYPKYS